MRVFSSAPLRKPTGRGGRACFLSEPTKNISGIGVTLDRERGGRNPLPLFRKGRSGTPIFSSVKSEVHFTLDR